MWWHRLKLIPSPPAVWRTREPVQVLPFFAVRFSVLSSNFVFRKMNASTKTRAALLLALLAPAAVWAMPWSHDMVVQQIVRPLLIMFEPAPGSVALGSVPPASNDVGEREFHNPLAATPENLAAGKKFFEIHCAVCHGPSGRGDGPVAGGAMAPADLTSPVIQARSDGYLYSVIRNGVRSMPSYRESLNSDERWQVVLFVRTFAGQSRDRNAAKR